MENDNSEDALHDEMSGDLSKFTKALVKDLEDLRAGKISNADARVRAQLAREVLRAAHLNLQGLRFFAGQAQTLPAPEADDAAPS